MADLRKGKSYKETRYEYIFFHKLTVHFLFLCVHHGLLFQSPNRATLRAVGQTTAHQLAARATRFLLFEANPQEIYKMMPDAVVMEGELIQGSLASD